MIPAWLTISLLLNIIPDQEKRVITCYINTSKGDITIELYPEQAPLTVANFLTYVDSNLYDSSSFFRVTTPENEADRDIKIEVIQGGNIDREHLFDPIEIETTEQTGLTHLDGTISMARSDPNTATSQFFICIGDQPELDYKGRRHPDGYGFAAFGKVIKGMEVVKAIQSGTEENQYLLNPIRIFSIEREDN
jgi:peptidyl-prolyl cis-trans isomerase A (cyclophilin A)